MFQCNQCHTEYGGIRGISAHSCPRCQARQDGAARQHSAPALVAAPAPRQPSQAGAPGWALLNSLR
jgi:hypothetical protein